MHQGEGDCHKECTEGISIPNFMAHIKAAGDERDT